MRKWLRKCRDEITRNRRDTHVCVLNDGDDELPEKMPNQRGTGPMECGAPQGSVHFKLPRGRFNYAHRIVWPIDPSIIHRAGRVCDSAKICRECVLANYIGETFTHTYLNHYILHVA